MKDIDKMSDNELRAEVRVLRPVYEAVNHIVKADYDYVSYYMGSGDWGRVKNSIAAVEALDEK